MAVILASVKWQTDLIDFTATAIPGGTTELEPSGTFFPPDFPYALNDSFGAINLRGVIVSQFWGTNDAATTHVVLGDGLMVDAQKNLTGGTARVLVSFATDTPNIGVSLSGVSLDVADLIRVSGTATGADDAALLAQALSGNDLAGLSGRDDRFQSGGGIDLVFSNGGDDRVILGDSLDCAIAGRGNDKAYGGAGDDLLAGNQGNDTLFGGADRDMIDGGRGRDTLTGGAGADTFVFLPGDGRDTITDFNPAEDVLSFGVLPAAPGEVMVTDAGRDTRVTFRDISILLLGRDPADLALDPYVFRLGVSEARLDTFVNFFDFRG